MSLRFTHEAADALRRAIREAEGVEVFAVGEVEAGRVVEITVTCRGRADRVNALLDRPRTGQVVIHNHPSGNLQPSDADMELAGLYGDDGVGAVIVDSEVTRSNWVVEPHAVRQVPVDPEALERFFREALPAALPDAEVRAEQIAMARNVAASLSEERPLVVEAGTGTGKSLAYLVPAALWALANDQKVVVSTYTRALQSQLFTKDLPLLAKAGIEVRYAVLQGRNNYVCKRRLHLADTEEAPASPDERAELDALVAWEAVSTHGARTDLPHPIDPLLWERVESDSDLTLRVRCPHYATCHYYRARREAAGAHIVVVNHALLLADLALRDAGAPGVLPRYHRLVIDEAHHLEDAATGAIARRSSLRGLQRAAAPLLPRRRRPGGLARLVTQHASAGSALPPERWAALEVAASGAAVHLDALRSGAGVVLEDLAARALEPDAGPRRVTPADEGTPFLDEVLAPAVDDLVRLLDDALGGLDRLLEPFRDLPLPPTRAQSVLDVRRARRRLRAHAEVARAFLTEEPNTCRWLEPSRGRGAVSATLVLAPIEVAETLRRLVWDRLPGTTATSATLAVARTFDHWMERVGLEEAETALHLSPFDHATQALLGLPRDLPRPDTPGFLEETARCTREAIAVSGGGAFVLCTSYAAVRAYGDFLRAHLPAGQPVLVQATTGRAALLERFRANPNSVLVGTDSFWEGVSVKGVGLRLVIIPRLPFRVPTDPLQKARHEQIERRGGNPFHAYTLPQAVIKLRQGYGRLIRARTDRGAVLLLDRRIHDRSYGRVVLHSLPPARRVNGPWKRVREALERFFGETTTPMSHSGPDERR